MPMRPAFRRSLFNKERALPRMSWSHENLYNLYQRTSSDSPLSADSTTTPRTSLTLYQQRWKAKRLGRGYHGDHLGQTKFERWYVPDALPSIHSGSSSSSSSSTSSRTNGSMSSTQLASLIPGRSPPRQSSTQTQRPESKGSASIGTMLYKEVERRIDVLIFRACLASSVWMARGFVVHGRVRINGVVVSNPNTRLQPGDIFSVDPSIIPMLSADEAKRAEKKIKKKEGERVKRLAGGVKKDAVASEVEGKEEAVAEGSGSEKVAAAETEEDGIESKGKESPEAINEQSKTSTESTPTTTPTPSAFFTLPPFAAPHIFIPAYLEVSFKTCTAVYVRHPTARVGYSEIPSPWDADGEVMSLGWEWFKWKAPNMTKRRHRWMDPERQNDRK